MSESLARMPVTITPSDLPTPRHGDAPYTISMVCTGNICRSAMAEIVLIDRLTAAGVPTSGRTGVVVTSAGVSDEERGNPIDRRARRLLAERDYGTGGDAAARAVTVAIAGHAAHRIGDAELAGADLVLAMTSAHRRELLRRAERLGVDLQLEASGGGGVDGEGDAAVGVDVSAERPGRVGPCGLVECGELRHGRHRVTRA